MEKQKECTFSENSDDCISINLSEDEVFLDAKTPDKIGYCSRFYNNNVANKDKTAANVFDSWADTVEHDVTDMQVDDSSSNEMQNYEETNFAQFEDVKNVEKFFRTRRFTINFEQVGFVDAVRWAYVNVPATKLSNFMRLNYNWLQTNLVTSLFALEDKREIEENNNSMVVLFCVAADCTFPNQLLSYEGLKIIQTLEEFEQHRKFITTTFRQKLQQKNNRRKMFYNRKFSYNK